MVASLLLLLLVVAALVGFGCGFHQLQLYIEGACYERHKED